MNETRSRIEPKPMSEMRKDWEAILERIPGKGLKGEGFPSNVLGTMMYSEETFGPFLNFWVTSKLKMALSVREQELVILRMGKLYQSEYVWKHHVPVGKEFGVTDRELEVLRSDGGFQDFTGKERALLELTDELVNRRTIRQEMWQPWAGLLSETEIVDLISLVSQYVFFALVNNAIQVDLEQPLLKVKGLKEKAH